MPTNLLLLPLLGGYWFIHTLSYTRIRSQALDGYRLLLESAMAGLCFGIAARWMVYGIGLAFPAARTAWQGVAPEIPYLGTAAGAALIGFVLPYPLNAMFRLFGRTPERDRKVAIERGGSQIHILLQDAANAEIPISFTLDNRKVYIGVVVGAPGLRPTDTSLSIIPWLSGYRDKDTLNLIFTVNYLKVIQGQQLDPHAFTLAVPLSSIRMIGFFDPSIYPAFTIEEEGDAED